MISEQIKAVLRDVPNFPKPGIVFKDITPLLANTALCNSITSQAAEVLKDLQIEAIAGIESRGFLFGFTIANALGVPFVPIRKAGKLPYKTITQQYDLEYGQATIEMHTDAIAPGTRVLIHDDLLATGGTAAAAANLIKQLGGTVAAYHFIVELGFLNGREILAPHTPNVLSMVSY